MIDNSVTLLAPTSDIKSGKRRGGVRRICNHKNWNHHHRYYHHRQEKQTQYYMHSCIYQTKPKDNTQLERFRPMNIHAGYLDLREAISMEKRYFTSDLSIRS